MTEARLEVVVEDADAPLVCSLRMVEWWAMQL